MSDNTPEEQNIEAVVEDALQTYPQVQAPALHPAVMARIQALGYRPRFRLAWIDCAVSLFFAGIAAWLLWPLLSDSPPTPPLFVPTSLQTPAQDILGLMLLLGLALAGAMLCIAAVLFEQR